jgi:hypothetical protein
VARGFLKRKEHAFVAVAKCTKKVKARDVILHFAYLYKNSGVPAILNGKL